MVWLHGGGWRRGAGSSARTHGENLASHGVVVVTLNFRLGILGFMAHPALSAETMERVSSNYALLDIIAALCWIRQNIAAFGGDPKKVTLFGQSSGAQAVCDLMISPLAQGLFHRAIMQSAPVLRPGYAQMTLSQAEQEGRRYGEDIISLRVAKLDDLLAYTPAVDYETRANIANPHYPILDGFVLPSDEKTAFCNAAFAQIPVMIGNTVAEARHYKQNVAEHTLEDYQRYLKRRFAGSAQEAARLYPAHDDESAVDAQALITADTSLSWGVRECARRVAPVSATYRYLYAHSRDGLPPTHSDEIAVLFGNEVDRAGKPAAFSRADREVSKLMQCAWVNFAERGDPNGPGVDWRPFTGASENYLRIQGAPENGSGWRDEHIDFIGRTLRR
jgi:carboxylesterase type B